MSDHDIDNEIIIWKGYLGCTLSSSQGDYLHLMVSERKSCKFIIKPKEGNHNMPHFHARWNGYEASYSIEKGKAISRGRRGNHLDKVAYKYRQEDRRVLAIIWNETRPSDVPSSTVSKSNLGFKNYDHDAQVIEKRIRKLLKNEQWSLSANGYL